MKNQIDDSSPSSTFFSNLNNLNTSELGTFPSLISSSNSSSSKDDEKKTEVPNTHLLNYPYGNKLRYDNLRSSWYFISNLINDVFADLSTPSKIKINDYSDITGIIFSYSIYNGLNTIGEFNSLEINNIVDHGLLYEEINKELKRAEKPKAAVIARTIEDDLFSRLKIQEGSQIYRTPEWKSLSGTFAYNNIINFHKQPYNRFFNALIMIASFFSKNEVISVTKLRQLASSVLCKKYGIEFEFLSRVVVNFNTYTHIITYLSIQDVSAISTLIEANLKSLYNFLKLQKQPIDLSLNLLKHFELWVYLGFNPIFLIDKIKKSGLFTCALVNQIILRCLQFANVYSDLLVLPSLSVLRHMDKEEDAVFMTIMEGINFHENLAKIITMCEESKAINYKINKQNEPLIVINILNAMIPSAIKKLNNELNNNRIEYYYDIAIFIKKYVKPEHILSALGSDAHSESFGTLIQNFFPMPSAWTTLAHLLQKLEVQLGFFQATFLPILRSLQECAPEQSKNFWKPSSAMDKPLFDHFMNSIAFICLFPTMRNEHRDVKQLITDFVNSGAMITQTTVNGYVKAKDEFLFKLRNLASTGTSGDKSKLTKIRNKLNEEPIEKFLKTYLKDSKSELEEKFSSKLLKAKRKELNADKFQSPLSKKLAINPPTDSPLGQYQIPQRYREAIVNMSLELLSKECAQGEALGYASTKILELTREFLYSSKKIPPSSESYVQNFRETLSKLIGECILSEVVSKKISIEQLKQNIISEMQRILNLDAESSNEILPIPFLPSTLSSRSQSLTSSFFGEENNTPANNLPPLVKPISPIRFQFSISSSSSSSCSSSSSSSTSAQVLPGSN